MLLTAAMQSRLAYASQVATAPEMSGNVQSLAAHVKAIGFGVVEVDYISASWLEFRDHVHLSISGSNDAHDWVQNLSAKQATVGELTCHYGFLRSANLIRNQLNCSDSFPADKPIVVGGHSAGGAIAEILVAIMPNLQWREIVTFGSPRVWSVDSAPIFRAMDYEVHRFVISGDPVPALPFRKFRRLFNGAEYSHASQPLEITADGRVLLDRGSSTLRRAIGIAAGAWLYGLASIGMVKQWVPTLLSRHYLSNYRDRILAAVERIETK